MHCNPYNLLRRTFLVAAAAASVAAFPNAAFANGNVTKADGTQVCTAFDTISLGVGGIVINGCTTGTTTLTGSPGTFTVAATTQQMSLNQFSANNFVITRSGGSTGAATVTFDRAGGCGPGPLTGDSVAFADGQLTANAAINTPNNDATCTVTLKTASAGTVGSPAMAYVLVGAGAGVPGTPPPPPPAAGGCPTPPADAYVNIPIRLYGNDLPYMKSGQIGYTTLPTFASMGGAAGSAQVRTGITTGSANGTVEISINKCPGVIDTTGAYNGGATGGKCYKSVPTDGSLHWQTWFEVPGANPAATDSLATSQGICEAYASKGPWYVNIRYNFDVPAYPAQANNLLQYQWDAYTP